MVRKEKADFSYPEIGIIGDALAPNFNEAYANEIYLLSQELKAPVLTGNDLGFVPFKRLRQYLIVNTKFLRRKSPILSLLNGALFYPFIKFFARKFDVIFLPAGIDSGFFSYLDLKKCILIINSLPYENDSKQAKMFSQKFASKLRGIIAQSKRIKTRLIEMGVSPEKIQLVYPWIDLEKFSYSEPPAMNEFRILFASAPNDEIPGEDVFWEKGLPLLLQAFKQFVNSHKAFLRLIWRECYNKKLAQMLEDLDLTDKVRVINEVTNMPELYGQSHITVVPFLNTRRSPEIPLSAVESLLCGRPIVTTDVAEIAEIVRDYRCGCVAKPMKKDFFSALVKCKRNYLVYQKNCRATGEGLFGLDIVKLAQIHKVLLTTA